MRTSSLAQEVNPRVRGLFIKNLADFQTELARIQAALVPGLVVWEQRKKLPELVFRSMRRVQDLRIRGRELGVSFADMHFSRAAAGRELLDEICNAPSLAEALRAAMITVPQILVGAIDDYIKRNDNIYDLPTLPLLTANRDELAAHIDWADAALRVLRESADATTDPGFAQRIANLAASLPSALREHSVKTAAAVQSGRRIGILPLLDAVLPQGFNHLKFGPKRPAQDNYSDRARFRAVNFLQEVQASDSCASLLFEAPDMPWDFYFDLARHMWDESRHAMFGEKKLADLGTSAAQAGLSSQAYAMRQTLTPHDRYAALTTQEADAFPGKHAGLKDAVAHQDSVSAMAWSYDIADETQHVRFGNKWLPLLIEKGGESRSIEQVKTDACTWRESVLAAVYLPAATTFAQQ